MLMAGVGKALDEELLIARDVHGHTTWPAKASRVDVPGVCVCQRLLPGGVAGSKADAINEIVGIWVCHDGQVLRYVEVLAPPAGSSTQKKPVNPKPVLERGRFRRVLEGPSAAGFLNREVDCRTGDYWKTTDNCAVRQGPDVVFTTCASLTQSLNAARATGSYERKLATLARVPPLIIDDVGMEPLSSAGRRRPVRLDRRALRAGRHNRHQQRRLPEWDQAFPANRLQASASLDRLRHNAYRLVLDGQSLRAPKHLAAVTKISPQKPAKSPSA
jgi:hypothetical protein